MRTLESILDQYRVNAQTEHEKDTSFELLIQDYLTAELAWVDLYGKVWM